LWDEFINVHQLKATQPDQVFRPSMEE